MTRIAIFASGNGGNFAAIVEACMVGKINASTVLLVCDKPDAFVIERAKKYNVPCFIFNPKDYAGKAEYENEILNALREKSVDLVCLAGYMRIVGSTLLAEYEGRILNIHPALLPAFKGTHAIRDAFDYGVKVFGATVHLIDKTIDGGTIIAQRAFEYYGNDINEVEAKMHEVEHELYVQAIYSFTIHI